MISRKKLQTKTDAHKKNRRAKASRLAKLSFVIILIVSVVATHLAGRVASKNSYTSPYARLEHTATPGSIQPVDEVVSAEVAAVAAKEADLLVSTPASNRADTIDAQVAMATEADKTTTAVVEKPQFVAPSAKSSQNIQTITTKEGDTVASLAKQYGISEDTIRWANNLKSDALAPNTQLTILPVSGVLHTVASGETTDTIAATYRASSEQIVAFNDAETNGLTPGAKIVVPNGVKPAPVAPQPTRSSSSSSTSTVVNTKATVFAGNAYAYGYCTWYSYNKRAAIGKPVGSFWGNATTWAANARAAGFAVDKNPQAGDVFQTSGGWGGYGHVGFVERVEADGSVFVSEMNYAGWNVVSTRTIPASQVGSYNFIH